MLLVTVAMVEPGVIFCLNLGGNQGIHPFGNKALIILPMAIRSRDLRSSGTESPFRLLAWENTKLAQRDADPVDTVACGD